jgi:hypothetical protein
VPNNTLADKCQTKREKRTFTANCGAYVDSFGHVDNNLLLPSECENYQDGF